MSNSPDSRYSARVQQAAGVVSLQADCELAMAYVLMQHQADHAHVLIDDIADSVLDGSIRFA